MALGAYSPRGPAGPGGPARIRLLSMGAEALLGACACCFACTARIEPNLCPALRHSGRREIVRFRPPHLLAPHPVQALARNAIGSYSASRASLLLQHPSLFAILRQPSTTTLRNGSVFVQQLCSDSDLTRCGYLPASHNPVAAPKETPLTCARSTPIVCMDAATSSASISIE